MKVGDLVRLTVRPHLGLGIVLHVGERCATIQWNKWRTNFRGIEHERQRLDGLPRGEENLLTARGGIRTFPMRHLIVASTS